MEGNGDRGRETRKLALLHTPFDHAHYGTISNAITNHLITESHKV